MKLIKRNKKYYFTVEGETEQWYLQWLQKVINSTQEAKSTVSFDCSVQKNPLKKAKSLVGTSKTELYHLADYESNEPVHVEGFQSTMDNMAKVNKMGKELSCKFGYSNFTFDLWMILHKSDCRHAFAHRKDYITQINKAYGQCFENMDKYKREDNFKKLLSMLTINDVISAVDRAKIIMQHNIEEKYVLHKYKGYNYYKENPSLSLGEILGNILKDCKLIN